MSKPSLPFAFAFLEHDRNLAVDDALVEALPHLEPEAQFAALRLLAKREHVPSLAAVAIRFTGYPAVLQSMVVQNAIDLAGGLQSAIASPLFEQRASAMELIARSDTGRLAYLLDEALRSRDPRTRELAAAGIHQMTLSWRRRLDTDSPGEARAGLASQGDGLADAVGSAVRRWESHLQPKVLDAALLLGDRVEPIILRKLSARRSHLSRSLQVALASAYQANQAGAVLRSLAIPDLRTSAAQSILRGTGNELLRGVLGESWLLADPRIERGCRWVQYRSWVHNAVRVVSELDASSIAGAVRFLSSIGGPHDRRLALLKELVQSPSEEAREAAVWTLVHDPTDPATDLLTVIAARPGDSAARMAENEVRRRRGRTAEDEPKSRPTSPTVGAVALPDLWERFWNQFDDPNAFDLENRETIDAVRRRAADVVNLLSAKFASAEPLNRVRALRVAARLGLVKHVEPWVLRAAFDPDAVVRSIAVGLVAELQGPTVRRILERALDDPDDRVQAGAIEAIDRLQLPDRVRLLEPKLDSQHPRVRANAVKALLCLELPRAAETLLAMLDDEFSAHRLSGLWVVEKLRLPSLRARVEQIRDHDPDRRVRRRAGQLLAIFQREGSSLPTRTREAWRAGPMTPTGFEEV